MEPTIVPTMPERDVAERLASYNLLAVAVCDTNNLLLGAITVDELRDQLEEVIKLLNQQNAR